ncbi:MAG: thiolase family protein [Spirochaetales bacterium]
MNQRIAIVSGVRSPMAKAGTALKETQADDLGAIIVREALLRSGISGEEVSEVIIGNVAQPSHAANIARVIGLKAGLPNHVPAFTVHRNCASGMQAVTSAAEKILLGYGSVYLAGGVESMTNIPLIYPKEFQDFMRSLGTAKTFGAKAKVLSRFRLSMLKPRVGLMEGLTDPVSGLIMGETAEVLARDFHITREEQDRFALRSHRLATKAQEEGLFEGEIYPVPKVPGYHELVSEDVGPRPQQSMEALAKLPPYFDKRNGTVTAGNSSQITDGAAAVVVMSENEAKRRGIEPLGYLREFAYGALEAERMGLGPAFATARLFERTGAKLSDIDYIEINEAFAAQMLAVMKAFASDEFAKKHLGRDRALGEIPDDILNSQGGAIALGHPVGMTGTRLIIHVLLELRRRNQNTGLATLCVQGGQGAALLLEVA